ncbi:helix-turn-helix domain-containing protein [Sphingomonas colocasiae]|uniref:Helix-turn-helix domain-containing protein n=1 Tax=Sphingomonas colocasiae TaxID=1848973 RepID=A0ABS7PTB0_9SPHN|nr:helix-turn-helix domain-containing protein [Sphingomonas colocasiae]MBY8824591.1 helix-turn-helix domain-containing protein [Sphingomonas colocasiae]
MSEAEGEMFPRSVGERLADARRAAGLETADIATRTRIPLRHLEALEQGRYDELPGVTYCIGFAKSYARALDLDEVAIARDVRAELNSQGGRAAPEYFEPADPARVPPRTLAWTLVILILLVVGGYTVWRTMLMNGLGDRDPAALAAGTDRIDAPTAANTAAPRTTQAAAPATGEVVLTATDTVWLRISDAGEQRLFEKEMQPGERYQVPTTAKDPRILTGRPDALRVTIGGREVAPLGPPQETIRDVAISAAALAARPAQPPMAGQPAPSPSQPVANTARP